MEENFTLVQYKNKITIFSNLKFEGHVNKEGKMGKKTLRDDIQVLGHGCGYGHEKGLVCGTRD